VPQRSKSPAAIRARARRARQRNGVDFDIRLRTNTRRLIAMLRASARTEGKSILKSDKPSRAETEREANVFVEVIVARWIGPAKKPHAYRSRRHPRC
jgi:hypothetical protein